jgi:hypothetical protein
MRLPRMTIRRWMIVVAVRGWAWRSTAGGRHGGNRPRASRAPASRGEYAWTRSPLSPPRSHDLPIRMILIRRHHSRRKPSGDGSTTIARHMYVLSSRARAAEPRSCKTWPRIEIRD